MMDFDALLQKVNDGLDQGDDLKISAADIEHMSQEQISAIQEVIDRYNRSYIEKALKDKVINKETAEYLHGIYDDSMKTYKMLYSSITNTILDRYGNKADKSRRKAKKTGLSALLGRKIQDEEFGPQAINAINLETGEVELNPAYDASDKKYKEYHPRHVTPFTSMRLVFYDYRGNPLYVIMPGLKNVKRAIDKVRLPAYDNQGQPLPDSHGGKYFENYVRDVNRTYTRLAREGKSEKEIFAELKKVEKPHERLRDVLRLTILRKYLSDIRETEEILLENRDLHINAKESRDGYKRENINDKNYRDMKVYPHLDIDGRKAAAEIQIKIIKFYEGDIRTHDIYAGTQSEINPNDLSVTYQKTSERGLRYWLENLKNFTTEADRRIAHLNIFARKQAIQKCNKDVIREYNLIAIDKAFRIETAQLASGEGYDAACANPLNNRAENICLTSADFLMENLAYRAFKAYDMQNAFSVDDAELKNLGLLITSDQLKDFTNRYSRFIIPNYSSIFNGEAIRENLSPSMREKLDKEFLFHGWFNYGGGIKDTNRPDKDEIEVLEAMERRHYKFGAEESEADAPQTDKTVDNLKINKHNNKGMITAAAVRKAVENTY